MEENQKSIVEKEEKKESSIEDKSKSTAGPKNDESTQEDEKKEEIKEQKKEEEKEVVVEEKKEGNEVLQQKEEKENSEDDYKPELPHQPKITTKAKKWGWGMWKRMKSGMSSIMETGTLPTSKKAIKTKEKEKEIKNKEETQTKETNQSQTTDSSFYSKLSSSFSYYKGKSEKILNPLLEKIGKEANSTISKLSDESNDFFFERLSFLKVLDEDDLSFVKIEKINFEEPNYVDELFKGMKGVDRLKFILQLETACEKKIEEKKLDETKTKVQQIVKQIIDQTKNFEKLEDKDLALIRKNSKLGTDVSKISEKCKTQVKSIRTQYKEFSNTTKELNALIFKGEKSLKNVKILGNYYISIILSLIVSQFAFSFNQIVNERQKLYVPSKFDFRTKEEKKEKETKVPYLKKKEENIIFVMTNFLKFVVSEIEGIKSICEEEIHLLNSIISGFLENNTELLPVKTELNKLTVELSKELMNSEDFIGKKITQVLDSLYYFVMYCSIFFQ